MTGGAERIVIGVSDCGTKFENYTRWLESSSPQIQTVKLSSVLQNETEVDRCDGVLMTGGGDIHPRFFGKPEAVTELDPNQVDERRDEFELSVVDRVIRRGIPLLGICRGMQVVNVYRNGDLVLDLVEIGKNDHSAITGSDTPSAGMIIPDRSTIAEAAAHPESRDRYHPVIVESGSQLYGCIHGTRGTVNSSHHQAIGRVGKELRATAWSDDGIIEALESTEVKAGFLLLIQWHPERMALDNPFSSGVREGFLDAVRQYAFAH